MAVYNYASGEVNIKIVYYGAGLSGKTTNLESIYAKMPKENKGKMVSMKTRTDRTLFFDFLPIEIGEINGLKTRFLLYTVPGQVYYNATRKLVLKGVDAIIFVADSASDRLADNKESIKNLEENLNEIGISLSEIPWVIQYNKRDLPDVTDSETLETELNDHGAPSFDAVATTGEGVYETFEGIAQLVFRKIREDLKNVKGFGEVEEKMVEEEIDVEIVAKGTSGMNSPGADESESLNNAGKKEEEHESVSEFVDSVLTEEGSGQEGVDLGATRGGYEEYGHVVDLNGSGAGKDHNKKPEEQEEEKDENDIEIIANPLDRPSISKPKAKSKRVETVKKANEASKEQGSGTVSAVLTKEKKTIKVPVEISADDIGKNVQVKLLLQIKVKKD
jgi:signal recognition particle receptor subunit beta